MNVKIWAATAAISVLTAGCGDAPPETPPRQLSESTFHYPEELWDARVEGETVVEIHVSAEGSVDSAKVEATSGYAAFDSAAVDGARNLRFDPARSGQDSIAVRVLLPVQFHLPDADSMGLGSDIGGEP